MEKEKDESRSGGLGDTLARVIHSTTGIKPCDNCTRRKEKLNKWFPYTKRSVDT